MTVYDGAHELARIIKESDEVTECKKLREIAEMDDTNRALLHEYKRLQIALQMQQMSGRTNEDDAGRFSKIASLLYMNADVQAYLMAEMRQQRVMADIFQIISEAGGINLDLAGG